MKKDKKELLIYKLDTLLKSNKLSKKDIITIVEVKEDIKRASSKSKIMKALVAFKSIFLDESD
jgi:hypothetical protein